ncbi:MAG: PrsW family intramembrane metalloprotease [Minisyncoccota bacterium]
MVETIFSLKSLIIALAGGVLPALFWLWFWRRLDQKSSEPTGLVALSFAAGMAVVFFVLPVQKIIVVMLPFIMNIVDALAAQLALIPPTTETVRAILWAGTEEFGKFATVFLIAYQSKHFDEPMDAIIYLITAALGFAAMENTLYILKDIAQSGGIVALLDSNLRFIGATILHIVSAAVLGIAFAFAFYRKFWVQFIAGVIGITLATLLHAHFNLSIMEAQGTIGTLAVFARFWAAIIGIIILIKIVKRLQRPHHIS